MIRLYLAVIVVVDHLLVNVLIPRRFSQTAVMFDAKLGLNGSIAVIYFYVISGFLISFVLDEKYSERHLAFYKSRYIRIFSVYWPAWLFAVLMFGSRVPFAQVLGHPAQFFTGLFLLGSDWYTGFASYPSTDAGNFPAGLYQSWTLGAELTFYQLAPFLLRSIRLCIIVFALSLALRLSFLATTGWHPTWTFHFFPTAVMFFLAGHLSRTVYLRIPASSIVYMACAVASAATLILSIHKTGMDSPSFYVSITCFAVALPSIFDRTKNSRILNLIGDLSYGSAMIALDKATVAALGTPPSDSLGVITTGLFLVVAITISALTLILVEYPVAAVMRGILSGISLRRAPRSRPEKSTA